MIMTPPNTLLEMQKFMHDELHGKRDVSASDDCVTLTRQPRLKRIVRALLGAAPREMSVYREGDRVDSTAV